MKKILLSLFIICIPLCSFSQKDKPDCLDKIFNFFTAFDGFCLTAGYYEEDFNPINLSSGTYFCRLRTDTTIETK